MTHCPDCGALLTVEDSCDECWWSVLDDDAQISDDDSDDDV